MPTLDDAEIKALKQSIGNMASPFSLTVAQLWLALPHSEQWYNTRLWGCVSVVLDRTPPRTVHIRMHSLPSTDGKPPVILFSQELYEAQLYTVLSPQFHCFETRECVCALAFSAAQDAQDFAATVKRMTPASSSNNNGNASNSAHSSGPNSPGSDATSPNSGGAMKKKTSGGGAIGQFVRSIFGSSKDVASASIGAPTNVQHRQHIGYDPEGGFALDDIPEEWKSVFKNAGIRKRDLANPEAAKLIFETLQSTIQQSHSSSTGGGGSVSQQQHQSGASMNASHPLAHQPQQAPQPPRSPPQAPMPAPKVPPSPKIASKPAPPLPSAIPQAPPVDIPAPPPIAETLSSSTSATVPSSPPLGSRSSNSTSAHSPASPSAFDLHAAIRGGIKLKQVSAPSKDDALPDLGQLSSAETNNLASVLQAAMRARQKTVQAEAQDDNDDDWN